MAATDVERAFPEHTHKAALRPKPRRSFVKLGFALILIVVIGSAGLLFDLYRSINSAQSSDSTPVSFVVHYGDTPGTVAGRLAQVGLVHGALLVSGSDLFKLDARLQGLSSSLVPGTFTLRRDMSIDQIVSVLAAANPREITVTVPPGYRSEQTAALLTSVGFNGRQFLHAVRHPTISLGFRVGWPKHRHTLEGFLFPDTYRFSPGVTGSQIADAMVSQFVREMTPALRRAARRAHRSVFRIVKMASIVQREDFLPSQMPIIASTYYNRLRLPRHADGGVGQLLQSDPTVSYALGHPGNWWPAIPADRRTIHSPFNTYVHYGLPPEPIANPDLSALLGALHPTKTHFYYFATKPNDNSGRLYFAGSYQQFCRIIRC